MQSGVEESKELKARDVGEGGSSSPIAIGAEHEDREHRSSPLVDGRDVVGGKQEEATENIVNGDEGPSCKSEIYHEITESTDGEKEAEIAGFNGWDTDCANDKSGELALKCDDSQEVADAADLPLVKVDDTRSNGENLDPGLDLVVDTISANDFAETDPSFTAIKQAARDLQVPNREVVDTCPLQVNLNVCSSVTTHSSH